MQGATLQQGELMPYFAFGYIFYPVERKKSACTYNIFFHIELWFTETFSVFSFYYNCQSASRVTEIVYYFAKYDCNILELFLVKRKKGRDQNYCKRQCITRNLKKCAKCISFELQRIAAIFFQKYITLSLRLPWASQPGDRGNRNWWSHGEYNRLNRRSNTSCRRKQWGNKPSSAAWPRERRISGTSIPKRSENEGERVEISDVQGAVTGTRWTDIIQRNRSASEWTDLRRWGRAIMLKAVG